jgi:hypothetical protein
LQLHQSRLDGGEDTEIAAARAPVVVDLGLEVFDLNSTVVVVVAISILSGCSPAAAAPSAPASCRAAYLHQTLHFS